MRGRRRLRRGDAVVATALPVALDAVAADLAGGATIEAALRRLASGDGPLAGEFATVLDDIAVAGGLSRALSSWAQRRPVAAVASAGLQVALETGAPAAVPLHGLAAALADQGDAAADARAAAAQTRVSAVVVGLAPVGSLGCALAVDPRVASVLVETGPGRMALGAGLTLDLLAAFVMRWLFCSALEVRAPSCPRLRRARPSPAVRR